MGDERRGEESSDARNRPGLMGTLQTREGPLGEPLLMVGTTEWRLRSVSHTVVLLLVALLASGVAMALTNDLLSMSGFSEAATPVVWYSTEFVVHFSAFLLVGIAYLSWQEYGSLVRIGLPTVRDWLVIVGGVVALFVVSVVSGVLFEHFDVEPAENVAIERGMEHPELFLALLPIQLFLTAPAEELLFRGIIQGLFRAAYGVIPAILIASTVFGLVHLPALAGGGGQLAVVVVLLTSGVILGVIYEYTGNLTVPILVHAAWNVLVFGTSYLEAIGTVIPQ